MMESLTMDFEHLYMNTNCFVCPYRLEMHVQNKYFLALVYTCYIVSANMFGTVHKYI